MLIKITDDNSLFVKQNNLIGLIHDIMMASDCTLLNDADVNLSY